jgi:hypothetical protein
MTGYPEQGMPGFCQENARWMVEMHPELSVVEGYLVFTDRDGEEYRTEHTWNDIPDGAVVDSTAWAFEGETLPYRYERDPQAWPRKRAMQVPS